MKIYNFRRRTYWLFVCFTIIMAGFIASFFLVEGAIYFNQPEFQKDLLQNEILNQTPIPLNNETVISALHNGLTVSFVGADKGQAFIYDENNGSIQYLKTSMPVFKAFGISAKQTSLLYSPLENRIPSGELFIENLEDGTATKITDDLVLEAEFSPNESKVAFTFANGNGFGLAIIDLDSRQTEKLISEKVLPDFIQWGISEKEIYYFENTNQFNTLGIIPRQISIKTKKSIEVVQDSLPSNFPKLSLESSSLDQASKEFSLTHSEIRYPFQIFSPDKTRKVCGGNLFGSSYIQLSSPTNLC